MNSLNTIVSAINSGLVQVISNIVPSPPTTLAYISSSATTSSVNISFTAPTPPPAIASYSPSTGSGSGTASTYTISGLSSNTSYSITLTATSINGKISSASSAVSVLTIPSAPTIGTVTVTGTAASVPFTAPSGTGTITGYTVTSSPGSLVGTGTSSPITVSGLTSGTAYTFTITATNASGTSAASSASNSVTPAVSLPGTLSFNNFSSCTFGGNYAIYGYFSQGYGVTNYTNTVSLDSGSVTLYIFSVGGGGGGGEDANNSASGGGGGGGVVQSVITSNSTDSISVGVGSGSSTICANGYDTSVTFTNKTNYSVIAYGGGGGGGYITTVSGPFIGGCGGGGTKYSTAGGLAVAGQGYNGGSAYSTTSGGQGGGGGAGGPGGDGTSTLCGNGGPGAMMNTTVLVGFSNSVYSTFYWAGGGAPQAMGATDGFGGSGGGGNGGSSGGVGTGGFYPAWSGSSGNAGYGAPNTGSGGGGNNRKTAGEYARGGSGIVFIAVPYNQITNNTTDIDSTGLVYKYIFNSNTVSGTSVTNLAKNAADATLTSTSCYSTTTSRIAGRGSLSGSSVDGGLTVNTFYPLFTSGVMSVCFWVNVTSLTTTFSAVYNIGGTTTSYLRFFGLSGSSTKLASLVIRGANTGPTVTLNSAPAGNGSLAVPQLTVVNVWTHFTIMTTSATNTKVYVNGILISTVATANVLAQVTPTSFVFGNALYPSYYDDIRIYNRGLSVSEIRQLCAYVGN